MKLQNWHKAMLHSVPAALGIDDAQRRMIQSMLAGERSAAAMDYAGFCRVMAHYESVGWQDARNGRGYWAAQVHGAHEAALRGKVLKLASLAGWIVPGRPPGRDVDFTRIDAFVARHFAARTRKARLRDCDGDELLELVEAFKSIAVQAGADVHEYHGHARPRRLAATPEACTNGEVA